MVRCCSENFLHVAAHVYETMSGLDKMVGVKWGSIKKKFGKQWDFCVVAARKAGWESYEIDVGASSKLSLRSGLRNDPDSRPAERDPEYGNRREKPANDTQDQVTGRMKMVENA